MSDNPNSAERLFDRVVDEADGEAMALSLNEAIKTMEEPITLTLSPAKLATLILLVQLSLKHPGLGPHGQSEALLFLQTALPLLPPGARRVLERGVEPHWVDLPDEESGVRDQESASDT